MGYQLIETVEVGSGGAASIEFTSIPQDGIDLLLVVSARGVSGGSDYSTVKPKFNNDSSANYDHIVLRGLGGSVSSFSATGDTEGFIGRTSGSASTANTFGSFALTISNYASTTDKSYSVDSISENNSANAAQHLVAGRYSTSSGISEVSMRILSDTFAQYSTASLYTIS
jgi:hypothetical protein